MKIVYIWNDDYVERAKQFADSTLQDNKSVKNSGGLKRPRMFLSTDDAGDYVKCYAFTHSIDKKIASPWEDIINLPSPCYYPLGHDGCVKLNNPIYVPKLYIQEINLSQHNYIDQKQAAVYATLVREAKIITAQEENIKKAIYNLWQSPHPAGNVIQARQKCTNDLRVLNYCLDEVDLIKSTDALSNLNELTKRMAEDLKLHEINTSNSTLTNIKESISYIKQDTITLAKRCKIIFDSNDKLEDIIFAIENKQRFQEEKSTKLKSKQGMKL